MSNFTTNYYDAELYAEYKLEYQTAKLNIVLASLVILLNIFHYCILTRKELRTLSVFILMKGICICDIIYLITEIIFAANVVRAYQRTDYCYDRDSFHITIFKCAVIATDESIQFSSIWLVVLMAFFRSLSILFPLNYTVEKVTSAKVTARIMLAVILLAFSWQTVPYFVIYPIHKMTESETCYFVEDLNATAPVQYAVKTDADESLVELLNEVQAGMVIFHDVLYALFTIFLIISIYKARKKQKRMRSSNSNEEKNVNTTKLVLAMTIVFLVAQSFLPAYMLVTAFFTVEDDDPVIDHIFDGINTSLLIVHSSSHCIVTLLMSSQYQDTVRKVLGIQNKQNQVADAPTSMATSAA